MARFICTALSAVAQAGLFSLFLGSCAAVTRDNPEIYRVGELEVRLYQDQDKLARDLPVLLTLINATKIGDRQLRILGYYDKQKRRIYSIDDARILLHEFKHYLEPDWRHGIGVGRLQGLQAQAEQDLVECGVEPRGGHAAFRGVSDLQEDSLSASLTLDLWREPETVEAKSLVEASPLYEQTVDDAKGYTDK